jgi:hypothetical protein
MEATTAPAPTTVSRLVGLPEEEREALVHNRYLELLPPRRAAELLDEEAHPVAPFTSFAASLAGLSKDQLTQFAREAAIKGYSRLNKAGLAQALTDHVAEGCVDIATSVAAVCDPGSYEALRSTLDAGGVVTFADDEAEPYRAWRPVPPLLVLFHHEGAFTFVLLEEFRAGCAQVDWAFVEGMRQEFNDAETCANVCTELAGVVEVHTLYERWVEWYGHSSTEDQFLMTLDQIVNEESGDGFFHLAVLNDEVCAVSNELDYSYADVSEEEIDAIEDYLSFLARSNRDLPLRDVPAKLRSQDGLLAWKRALPSMRRLRDYLDAHVPQGADELTYSADVTTDLALDATLTTDPNLRVKHLETLGVPVNKGNFSELRDLMADILAELPSWEHNGWSPREAAELRGEHPGGAQPGGGRKEAKVGRNDPCPCGSGKKFKKCCGAAGR